MQPNVHLAVSGRVIRRFVLWMIHEKIRKTSYIAETVFAMLATGRYMGDAWFNRIRYSYVSCEYNNRSYVLAIQVLGPTPEYFRISAIWPLHIFRQHIWPRE